MEIPAALLSAFPPSADLLLDRARLQTDDSMLMVIARADYGVMADEMMAELRAIRDTGFIPDPMPFQLFEVLTLTRYSDPDSLSSSSFEPGPTGRSVHQSRLFACAVLLRAVADVPRGEEFDSAPEWTLASCLVSVKVLGEELSVAVACFLTWQISRRESDPSTLLLAVGLLILAIRLRSERFSEPTLGRIADWVLDMEAPDRKELPEDHTGPLPLSFSLQVGAWGPLAAELRSEADSIRDDDMRTNFQLCELILDPGW